MRREEFAKAVAKRIEEMQSQGYIVQRLITLADRFVTARVIQYSARRYVKALIKHYATVYSKHRQHQRV